MRNVLTLVIAVALTGIAGAGAAQTPAPAAPPDGAALYRQQCRSCHGLKGVPPRAMLSIYAGLKSFADSAWAAANSEQAIVAVLENGQGKDMKSFKDKLAKDEMVAVAKYVRTLATAPAAPTTP
jgi:mono/diheme cytochrome c family protein